MHAHKHNVADPVSIRVIRVTRFIKLIQVIRVT